MYRERDGPQYTVARQPLLEGKGQRAGEREITNEITYDLRQYRGGACINIDEGHSLLADKNCIAGVQMLVCELQS